MGLNGKALGAILSEGEAAVEREFMVHGLLEDKENFRKVVGGTWGDGATLTKLLAHPNSKTAKLELVHVLVLRLYTTSSFARVNDPLRQEPPQRPHPFAATTYFIGDGIKRLRAVAAHRDDAHTPRTFWRGMKDLSLTMELMKQGGTEFACMSTTASQKVAVNFATSKCPLIFKSHAGCESLRVRGGRVEPGGAGRGGSSTVCVFASTQKRCSLQLCQATRSHHDIVFPAQV